MNVKKVKQVIASLKDQARDKELLANGDETSIFTDDANALRYAAQLLQERLDALCRETAQ